MLLQDYNHRISCRRRRAPGQANTKAQNQAPSPTEFPTFSLPGPLQAPPAHTSEAGPFGKLNYNFLVRGMGLRPGNRVPSDNSTNDTAPAIRTFGANLISEILVRKRSSWFLWWARFSPRRLLLRVQPQPGPIPCRSTRLGYRTFAWGDYWLCDQSRSGLRTSTGARRVARRGQRACRLGLRRCADLGPLIGGGPGGLLLRVVAR